MALPPPTPPLLTCPLYGDPNLEAAVVTISLSCFFSRSFSSSFLSCCACFCCCLYLERAKKRERMALRLPSLMSLAVSPSKATPSPAR